MKRYRELLRRREFALLWGGATVSALGDGMSFVALVWLLIERGGTAGDLGWLAAVYTAPVIVGGLAAGVILDRFDPRRVIAADNLIRGIAIASVPIAAALGALTTPHLFVVAGIYGLLFMTSIAGIPSLIPVLVAEEDLTTANALESISYGIAGLAGPAVAGVVIAVIGAPVVLAIDAVTYFVFVACLLAMHPGRSAHAVAHTDAVADAEAAALGGDIATEGPIAPAQPFGSGIGPAIRFVAGAPAILATTAMYMCLNVSSGLAIVLIPIYARDVLGGGSATYGLLLSSLTAGELVGLVVIGAIHWRWPLGRSIAAAATVSGLILSLLLLRPSLVPMILILAASGLVESSLTPWAQTIRMRLIPPALRGRVFALLRTSMQSTRPIGSVLAGLLLAGGNLTPALLAIALLILGPGAIGLWLPALGPVP
ncbi:MAG TPA: MFS transporter, partial [Candidatus Deferrimicrobium sp.]|nr:MFS transporter [Candidatus Deferrimicrobium sp.]